MKYAVRVTGDDGNWYYKKRHFRSDTFVRNPLDCTLFSTVQEAEKTKTIIMRDWKPKLISDTAKIIAVNFQIAEELENEI